MITTAELLAHRHRVPAYVLLDWADLSTLLTPPAFIETKLLQVHWGCHQCTVSRRMAALQRHGLAQITAGHRRYRVWGWGT